MSDNRRRFAFGSRHLLTTLIGLAIGPGAFAQTPERPEELIVTATRLPRTINEVAGTVTLITGQDIEREVANDLDDLTRYQPGISMDTASRGGNQGFIIRGMGGNRVLTVVDGVRSSDICRRARGTVLPGRRNRAHPASQCLRLDRTSGSRAAESIDAPLRLIDR